MNITSAQYKTHYDGSQSCVEAIIDNERYLVPLDPANRHYAAIIEWAEEDSNEIQAAD